jgi:hypothetical protein
VAALVKKAELGRAGITDPFEEHRNRPLDGHVEDYVRYLAAKEVTPKQARQGRVLPPLELGRSNPSAAGW